MADEKRLPRAAIQRAAFALTGNPIEAQILAALWWWEPYAKAKRAEKVWVVKTDEDFIEQDGVTAKPRAIRTALASLTAAQMIETTRGPHPSGRAPNSRYLRLREGVATRLENGIQKGRKNRIRSRIDTDINTASERQQHPDQLGTKSRFHEQEDDKSTSTSSSKIETRTGGRKIGSSWQEKVSPDDLMISDDLFRLQNAFDEGCKLQGWSAPPLNHPERVKRLQMFWTDCQAQRIRLDLACKIATRFAQEYLQSEIASELARHRDKVSATPDHFNLSLCSNYAISQYREAEIAEHVERSLPPKPFGPGGDPAMVKWRQANDAVVQRLRSTWPNIEGGAR